MVDIREIVLALGGRWHGSYGSVACPICQPEGRQDQTALTCKQTPDGRLLAHCKKAGCEFGDIVRALGLASGDFARPDPQLARRAEMNGRAEAERRSRKARAIWDQAQPLAGTLGETYLRARGLTCGLPSTLRFHPAAHHGPSAQRLPAIVAFVEGTDRSAIHRTWLKADGQGKAEVEPNKMMLGSVTGGSVRLFGGPGPLVVAEGIETALSMACGLLDEPFALWAALSANGLRALRLPANPGALMIATDGDAAGRLAGADLAARAHALGWQVAFCHAPDGRDWNDMIMTKGARNEG